MRKTQRLNEKRSGLRNYLRNASRRAVLLVSLIVVSCCTVLAFSVWAHTRSALMRGEVSRALTPPVQTSSIPSLPTQRMDIEVITIRPTGFERTKITRPKGLFGIAVENRSGLTNIVLRFDQEGGPRIRQTQLTRQNLNWKDRFDLVPGRYVLTEATHPDWQCNLTITEQ